MSGPEFSFAKRWFDSVGVLDPTDAYRVHKAVKRFLEDPDHPSLNLHPINNTKSNSLFSFRASDELRVLLHKTGNIHVLIEAGHHDAIYQRASRCAFVINGHTGFIGVIGEVPDTQPTPALDLRVAELPPDAPRPLDHWPDDALREAGLTPDDITQVRACRTEDDLYDLPQSVFNIVCEIIGTTPNEWRNPTIDEAAADEQRTRDALEKFGVLAGFTPILDSADAEDVLDAPIEDWMVYLHPYQRNAVLRRFEGPARVRGSAGTGKTVVALHRAAELARRYRGEKPILFTTFLRTLPPVLEHLYRHIPATGPGEVEFINIDGLAATICGEAGEPHTVDVGAADELLASAWTEVRQVDELRRAGVTFDYAKEEIRNVIKGRGLDDFEQYLDLDRTGRRMPLGPQLRQAMWRLYDRYSRGLAASGTLDFSDVLQRAAEIASGAPPRYRAGIIDEAQDLSLIGLQLVRAVVNGAGRVDPPDGLLIVGDGAQRIYPGGFTLKQAGIEVRGRTTVLRVNYRNTREIVQAALATAGNESVDDLGDEYLRGDGFADTLRSGRVPELVITRHPSMELDAITKRAKALTANATVGLGDIAVGVASNKDVDIVLQAFRAAGVRAQRLIDYDGVTTPAVKVGTHHRLKGLEFKCVFLPFLSSDRFPYVPRDAISAEGRREYEERALSVLYVALTRARDQLVVTCTGQPAPALANALDHFNVRTV